MTSQFTKLFSFILANVHDPAAPDDAALRLPCYSCMSPYLEEHMSYLQTLYITPKSFVDECNAAKLDKTYLQEKNCSDMCVTLRMTDVIGGRATYGYMRGCINDIVGFNHTVARVIEERYEASGRRRPGCVKVSPRSLFVSSGGRPDSNSEMELCGCFTPGCNSTSIASSSLLTILIFLLIYRQ